MYSLRDFIRAMKKSNRPQLYGALLGVDKVTGELCGCALGQAVLNTGLFDEEKIRQELLREGNPYTLTVYNPDTQKTESKRFLCGTTSEADSETRRALNFLSYQIGSEFKNAVIHANDRKRQPIFDIAAKLFEKWGN